MPNISERDPTHSPTPDHVAMAEGVTQSSDQLVGKLKETAEKEIELYNLIFDDPTPQFDDINSLFNDFEIDIFPTADLGTLEDQGIQEVHSLGIQTLTPEESSQREAPPIEKPHQEEPSTLDQIKITYLKSDEIHSFANLMKESKNPRILKLNKWNQAKALDVQGLNEYRSKKPQKLENIEFGVLLEDGRLVGSEAFVKKLAGGGIVLKNHKFSKTPLPEDMRIETIHIVSSDSLDSFRKMVMDHFMTLHQERTQTEEKSDRPLKERQIERFDSQELGSDDKSFRAAGKTQYIFIENAKTKAIQEAEDQLAKYTYQKKEVQKDEEHDIKQQDIARSEDRKYWNRKRLATKTKLKGYRRTKQAFTREINSDARADALERKYVLKTGKDGQLYGQTV